MLFFSLIKVWVSFERVFMYVCGVCVCVHVYGVYACVGMWDRESRIKIILTCCCFHNYVHVTVLNIVVKYIPTYMLMSTVMFRTTEELLLC